MAVRRRFLVAAAVVLLLAVCAVQRPDDQRRLVLLRTAFAEQAARPLEAARRFEAAGPGALLEQARLEAWLRALERSSAPSGDWRSLLEAPPPVTQRAAVLVGLGSALLAEGRVEEGVAALEEARDGGDLRALERLLTVADDAVRQAAGRRLAVADPVRLRRLDRGLEATVLALLGPPEWLDRARAWRAAGRSAAARGELRRLRFADRDEHERRLELARAEIAGGAPSAALRTLPSPARSGSDELLVRAEAHRRLGWGHVPAAASRSAFAACRDAAIRVDGPEAARLVVECATEAGDLDTAITAWRGLPAGDEPDGRGDWTARRLGVALAVAGRRREAEELAARLPDHARCLRFWASHGAARESVLRDLAAAGAPDLYALWARDEVGVVAASGSRFAPPVGAAAPPLSVRLLLEWGAAGEALDEWSRVAKVRGLAPGEALAAAELARSLGHVNSAIRWLRLADAELGGVELDRAPKDLARAYLPLDWREPLFEAAARFGLDPWLVAAVARQESVFLESARSPAGAVGVLQLVPGTGRRHSLALGLGGRPDLTDPALNLLLGSRELAALIDRFGAVEPALAGYNAGEARVRRWWRAWPDRRRFVEQIPIPETYTYVRRVVYLAEAYRLVYAGGNDQQQGSGG